MKKRLVSLDVARTFAILCVISTHATENTYPMDISMNAPDFPVVSRQIALALHILGRLGVPIFFMLTGYLLLNREYDTEKTKKFWKRNFFGVTLATVIWIGLYFWFNCWFKEVPFKGDDLTRQLLLLANPYCNHLWYMYQIVGIYLFLPFIANALKSVDKKLTIFPMIVAFLYLFIPPMLNVYYSIEQEPTISVMPNFSFIGGTYGLLIILGWMVKQGFFDKIKTIFFFIIAIAGYWYTWHFELYAYQHNIAYNVWYDSASLVIASFSLFMIFTRLKHIPCKWLFTIISKCSFGIYLCHNMFMMWFAKNLEIQSHIQKEWRLIVYTFVCSFIVVFLVSRIKLLGRILFFTH